MLPRVLTAGAEQLTLQALKPANPLRIVGMHGVEIAAEALDLRFQPVNQGLTRGTLSCLEIVLPLVPSRAGGRVLELPRLCRCHFLGLVQLSATAPLRLQLARQLLPLPPLQAQPLHRQGELRLARGAVLPRLFSCLVQL